ncbi:hemagglutinin-related autotransporter protein [Planoprotostelium fungivorum]|uniref:Hemagglutinin-related autotransporter protein n=1 Tax=Planoprotostelium fungivorum TaxID=1890364 RepID=A0A2P6MZB7_9EUKA|nr:hemagglutinin-related autotransporter protein [Planoprotostelium fungivorum]
MKTSASSVLICILLTTVYAETLSGGINAQLGQKFSLSVAAGATATADVTFSAGGLLNDVISAASGFSAQLSVTNNGQTSGTYNLYITSYSNVNFAVGFNSALFGTASASSNFGYEADTSLDTGSFSASLSITPSFTLSGDTKYQLFYIFNSTDGLSSSGSGNGNLLGTLSYTPNGKNFTFTLPSIKKAYFLYGNYNSTTINVNPFPALYNLISTTVAGAETLFNYTNGQAQSLLLSVKSDTAALVETAYSQTIAIENAAAVTFQNTANKAYSDLKAFYNFTITNAKNLQGKLVYTFDQTLTAAQQTTYDTIKWVKIAADGTATLLTTQAKQTVDAAGKTTYQAIAALDATASNTVQYAVFVEKTVIFRGESRLTGIQIQAGATSAAKQLLYGGVSTNQTLLLASVAVASFSTATTGSLSLVLPTPTGYTVTLFVNNTGSTSGTFSLYSTIFADVKFTGGITGALYGNGQAGASFGFSASTDLQPGSFSAAVTITQPGLTLSATAQSALFYFFNATDGYTSGFASASQTSQFGLVASIPATSTRLSKTFALQPVQYSNYLLASVDLQSPPVIPAIYNVAATVYSNANTTYNFAGNLAASVYSSTDAQVKVTAAATAQLANNAQVQITNAGKETLTAVGRFYQVTLQKAQDLKGQLTFTLDATTAAAEKLTVEKLRWVQIAADGTATVVTSFTVSGSASGSASSSSSNSGSITTQSLQEGSATYALYTASAETTTAAPSSGIALAASVALVAAALFAL